MRALALLNVCALLLAGCVGTEEAPDLAESAAPAPATPPDEGAPAPEADAAPPAADPAPTQVVTTLSWDGSLGLDACVPTGVSSCRGLGLPTGGGDRAFPLDGPGLERRVSLSLTWTPDSPLTGKLGVGIAAVASCGEGCTEGHLLDGAVEGASPLALDADLPPPEEGETFVVLVWQPRPTPPPVYGFAHTDQAFRLEGALVSEE